MDQSAAPMQYRLFIIQFLLVMIGLTGLALIPPAQGRMIAIPLFAPQGAAGMSAIVHSGTRIIGAGPFSGSLVLQADRHLIASIALRHGILLLPTTVAGCQITEHSA
jgi:hypothetical protein